MSREEIIQLMVDTFISDNTQMALQGGMDQEKVEEMTVQSKPGIQYLLANLYDKLDAQNLFVKP